MSERKIVRYLKNGEMSFYNRGKRIAEIGIKICEFCYQEKGLGRCILSLFLKELFSMGFQKIILDTDLENTRAQHVYELLGFRKVRVRKDSWVNQIGEPRSSIDYELTETDFTPFFIKKIRVSKGCSQISYWQIAQRQDSFCDFEETLENLSMPFCPQ